MKISKYDKLKKIIYCSKHSLEYSEENYKKAMELELEFGCNIELNFGSYRDYTMWHKNENRCLVINNNTEYKDTTFFNISIVKNNVLCKILGRPIRLNDIRIMLIQYFYKQNKQLQWREVFLEVCYLWKDDDNLDSNPEVQQLLINILQIK